MKKNFVFTAVLFFVLNGGVMSAQEGTATFYHLLIVDRINSPMNSDIGNVANATILYKFMEGGNGYIIMLYESRQRSLFPQLPSGASWVVNMSSTQKAAIRDYINSNAFRSFVTNSTVISDLLGVL